MKVTLFRTCNSRNKNYPFVAFNRNYKGSFFKDFESLDALAKYLSKTRCISIVPGSMSVKDRVTLFRKVRSLNYKKVRSMNRHLMNKALRELRQLKI